MESVGKKIIKNTIFNSVGRIWQILVLVLLTPYILHKLGVEVFAVWSLVYVVANYMGLLDFGIRTSFAKYIAEYHAKKDQESINAVINCGLIFYLGLSVLIIGLTFILRSYIISLLSIPDPIYSEAMFAILGMVLFVQYLQHLRGDPGGAAADGYPKQNFDFRLLLQCSRYHFFSGEGIRHPGFGDQLRNRHPHYRSAELLLLPSSSIVHPHRLVKSPKGYFREAVQLRHKDANMQLRCHGSLTS
jgi:hypothetical protein